MGFNSGFKGLRNITSQIYEAEKAIDPYTKHGSPWRCSRAAPPPYTRGLDTRATRTPCRTERERISHLPSSYATRCHHELRGFQLKVRMSLVAILSQANPLYILTPYFFTTPVIITPPTTARLYILHQNHACYMPS